MNTRLVSLHPLLLILLLLAMLAGCASTRVKGEFESPGGVRIQYMAEGKGEPVVLIHGFAVDANLNWRFYGVAQRLARHYRVVTFDNRGHGRSDKPHDPSQYGAELVEDVVRLMDHMGIEKAHVAGYSLGGFITLRLLASYPERLQSAVICSAGWERREGEHMRQLDESASALEQGDGFKHILRTLDPDENPLNEIRILVVDASLRFINDTQAMAAAVRSLAALEVSEAELRANRVPVLSIVGEHDPLKPSVDDLAAVLSNHRGIVLKKTNHHTAIRRPRLAKEMEAFFTQHRGCAAAPLNPANDFISAEHAAP